VTGGYQWGSFGTQRNSQYDGVKVSLEFTDGYLATLFIFLLDAVVTQLG